MKQPHKHFVCNKTDLNPLLFLGSFTPQTTCLYVTENAATSVFYKQRQTHTLKPPVPH